MKWIYSKCFVTFIRPQTFCKFRRAHLLIKFHWSRFDTVMLAGFRNFEGLLKLIQTIILGTKSMSDLMSII